MSTLINPYLPLSAPTSEHTAHEGTHHLEVPTLLDYRGEEDPDADFIPKTVAGFGLGALTMGICLDFAETFYRNKAIAFNVVDTDMLIRFVFMAGITGVSTSLFLVALKVRADRSKEPLYARHWLNSICTGGAYALLVWLPWVMRDHSLNVTVSNINPFIAVALLMILSAVPVLAARWTIGTHYHPPLSPS